MKLENEYLDNLVIELEETIGTSPHSREAIKDILQKDADFGKEKEESVNDDLEEESNKVASELYDEFFPQDGDLITPYDFRNGIKKVAKHFADWKKNQILNNNIANYVVFQKYIGKIGLEAVISKPGYETVWDADKIKVIAIEKDKL